MGVTRYLNSLHGLVAGRVGIKDIFGVPPKRKKDRIVV